MAGFYTWGERPDAGKPVNVLGKNGSRKKVSKGKREERWEEGFTAGSKNTLYEVKSRSFLLGKNAGKSLLEVALRTAVGDVKGGKELLKPRGESFPESLRH